MKASRIGFGVVLALTLLLQACNLGAQPTEPPTTEAPSPLPPSPTPAATDTPEPQPILGENPPGDPTYTAQQSIRECNTGARNTLENPVNVGLGCDRWQSNFIERPHDAEAQTYYPNFDIIEAQFGDDANWIFARIETFPASSNDTALDGTYGVEIDLNMDTRGDLLILADNPARWGAQWDMSGVQVWRDANDDVGAETAVLADGENPGDGYEELIFDEGQGEISEAAWVRISPDDSNVVEFAFKPALLEGNSPILWWVWASMAALAPGEFDYVDTYDDSTIYEIDNSCAWTYGGQPRADLANHCPLLLPTPTPTPTKAPKPPSGCTPQFCGDPDSYWCPAQCACIPIGQSCQ